MSVQRCASRNHAMTCLGCKKTGRGAAKSCGRRDRVDETNLIRMIHTLRTAGRPQSVLSSLWVEKLEAAPVLEAA